MDHIFSLPEIPAQPLKFRARAFQAVGGGNAATGAVTVSRLGGRARLIARLGADALGDTIVQELAAQGVDTALVRRFPGCASHISTIFVDEAGERLIVSFFDPKIPHEPEWLPAIPEGVGAVLADAHWPRGVAELFRRARAAGLPTVLDADMPTCPAEILANTTVAAFSAPGLAAATGVDSIEDGLCAATRLGPGVMLATDGGNGVFWIEGGRLWRQPAFEVRAVDTLGAGDVFHGALALGLAEGQSLAGAVALANAAAALKVTRFGGRAGVPVRHEVEELLRRSPRVESRPV